MSKRSLAAKARKYGQTQDEVLNTITDLVGLASQGWNLAYGPEKSGQMVCELLAMLAARYAITSLQPLPVAKDLYQMTLNAMLIYLQDMKSKDPSPSKEFTEQELLEAGAYMPKGMSH